MVANRHHGRHHLGNVPAFFPAITGGATGLQGQDSVERQKAGHYPTLSLVGRLNRDDQDDSLFAGGGSDIKTREATIQLNIPIFQGFSVSSRTREARQLYKAEKELLEKEIRAAKRETRAAFLGVKAAVKNAEAMKQSVIFNKISLEAKKEGFKAGLFPSLAVLDAERDFHLAKQGYAKANYEYILNSVRLKNAVGILTENDMAGINQWLE